MIYLFLADGFEEVEALCPYDLLLRAGAVIKTVSVNETKTVTGTHGITVEADITVAEIKETPEAVILPGGMPGASNLDENAVVNSILEKAYADGKVIGAICAAPFILGKRGMLKGKKATCFPGFENQLEGAEYTVAAVECDGNIVTARGMGVAFEFGLKLIERLYGREKMLSVNERTMAVKCSL